MIQSGASSLVESTIDLSVVFITYNRSDFLVESIDSLRGALNSSGYSYELIIADDCSSSEHAGRIESIPDARIVRTTRNSGLGANANNGIANSRGRLILQLQDDWKWVGELEALRAAVEFIDDSSDVGILQLTQVGTDLPVSCRNSSGFAFQVFRNDHVPWMRGCDVRPYSDQPHIKRREFAENVGAYVENTPMTFCENEYKHRVSNQSRWNVAMVEAKSLFAHLGATASFNPGGRRHPLIKLLHRLPGGARLVDPALRKFVRQIDHLAARLMAK